MDFRIKNENNTKSYIVTNECTTYPRVAMKSDTGVQNTPRSYLPLTTSATQGLAFRARVNNQNYRALEFRSMSGSATYYTSGANSAGMSSTTALTRASTSSTEYLTRKSTSGTSYLTRSSTSGTSYLTVQGAKSYNFIQRWTIGWYNAETNLVYRSGTVTIGDGQTFMSTSVYAGQTALAISKTGDNYNPGVSTALSITSGWPYYQSGYQHGTTQNYYTQYGRRIFATYHNTFPSSGTFTYYEPEIGLGYAINGQISCKGTIVRNDASSFIVSASCSFQSGYSYPSSTTAYVSSTINWKPVITTGTSYLTRASTSDTIYYTRSSTYDTIYHTRASTSGYSGVSSSSSETSGWQ